MVVCMTSPASGRGCASRLKQDVAKFVPGKDELLDAEYLATGFWACPRVVGDEILKQGGAVRKTFLSLEVQDVLALHRCIYNDGTLFYDYFRPVAVPSSIEVDAGAAKVYEYASEDWAFSYRARQANPNRPLYAWTLPHLVHHGSYGFTMKTAYLRE